MFSRLVDVIVKNKTFDDVILRILHFNFIICDFDCDVNMFDLMT